MPNEHETVTLGAGCFWCIEAVYQQIRGIESVVSGYSGGHTDNPSYRDICNGNTGHAEVAQITFDPSVISFQEILDLFWATHDPTTVNRQGGDVGTQYRSVIFYHNDEQRAIAEHSKAETDASDLWPDPIVTEIAPLARFYAAEDYHQNYYNDNGSAPYCRVVINPKVQKVRQKFASRLKE